MTAGLGHQAVEDLVEGASSSARPAVSFAWPLGEESESHDMWLDIFDGSDGRIAVAIPEGILGKTALARMADALGVAQSCGAGRMTIDFSHVRHLDYRGIADFLSRLHRCEAEGMDTVMVGLNRYLEELFRIAGVEPGRFLGGDAVAHCGVALVAGETSREFASLPAPPRAAAAGNRE